MKTKGSPRWMVLFGVLALLAATAGAALAAPLIIYTRWVGDTGVDPRSPDGAFFSYCDFGTLGDPNEYHCVPNQKFFSVPESTYSTFLLPDPMAGITSVDLNGDGKLDVLAFSANGPNFPFAEAGEATRTPLFGTFEMRVPPLQFRGGAVFPPPTFTALGFGSGQADSDPELELFVAHSTTGADLKVDIRNRFTGANEATVSLAVPNMNVVSRDPAADFRAFYADDIDGDGVVELLVLHTATPGLDAELIDIFHVDGSHVSTVTLSQDPAGGPIPDPYDEVYIGGYMHAPILDNGAKEHVILRVDHRSTFLNARQTPTMRYTLFRFNDLGSLIQSVSLQSVPIYTGAIAVGIAPLSTDNNCNGIDEDGDGTADDKYVPKVVTCGVGACKRQTQSSCSAGVETPAAACTPGAPTAETLNGVDDDCNGAVDDIGTLTCAPGQNSWWCCPTGADVRFSINTTADSLDETQAALACLPIGVAPAGATCSLRGVVRRAEELRQLDNVRPACRVVAELQAGDYQLTRNDGNSLLNLGGGLLTIKGMGATAADTIIEPTTATTPAQRILWAGLRVDEATANALGEHPPQLSIQRVTMRRGFSNSFSQQGGGAIAMRPSQAGAVLEIQDSIFDRNHAAQPGGAVQFWTAGTATIRRSVFRNNDSPDALVNSRGGAFSALGALVLIEDSTFAGNLAKIGGGIALDESISTLLNNTISQNSAPIRGGGVMAVGGTLTLRFNTIFQNMLPSGESGRAGGGLFAFDATLNAFGNIIAGSDFSPQTSDDGTSPDCSIQVTTGTPTANAGTNLIGAGGGDCAALGATGGLIGTASAPVVAQLDPLPAPRGPTDPFICQPGANFGQTCISVCNNMATPLACVNVPRTAAPASPAIGAFPTGASPGGAVNTCPLEDQRAFSRPNSRCTLGSIESNATMQTMANGNIQYMLRLPGPPVAYIEVFARQNGVQTVSGDFRSSQVANADGTFTYTKVVSGSSYHTGDVIDFRFYYYRSGQTGVFLPGPTAATWYPATTYRKPTATPSALTCKKANGDMQFSLTLNSRQAYVEAFVQQNNVQTGAGAITSSAVTNMNGTVTYTRTMAKSGFKATDVIRSRYYHYEARSPGTFQPGPGEQVFYPSIVYSSAPACP